MGISAADIVPPARPLMAEPRDGSHFGAEPEKPNRKGGGYTRCGRLPMTVTLAVVALLLVVA